MTARSGALPSHDLLLIGEDLSLIAEQLALILDDDVELPLVALDARLVREDLRLIRDHPVGRHALTPVSLGVVRTPLTVASRRNVPARSTRASGVYRCRMVRRIWSIRLQSARSIG